MGEKNWMELLVLQGQTAALLKMCIRDRFCAAGGRVG